MLCVHSVDQQQSWNFLNSDSSYVSRVTRSCQKLKMLKSLHCLACVITRQLCLPLVGHSLTRLRVEGLLLSSLRFSSCVPGAWYLVPASWYLVPGTWYLIRGTWYVPGTWYQVPGTRLFHTAPKTTRHTRLFWRALTCFGPKQPSAPSRSLHCRFRLIIFAIIAYLSTGPAQPLLAHVTADRLRVFSTDFRRCKSISD